VIPVDRPAWVHFLRSDGDPALRARVESALTAGDRDRKIRRDFEAVLPELPIDDEMWAGALGGVSVLATDILIAACASRHGVGLETADSDLERLTAV
jgi:predicted nucleic acid-binding protein